MLQLVKAWHICITSYSSAAFIQNDCIIRHVIHSTNALGKNTKCNESKKHKVVSQNIWTCKLTFLEDYFVIVTWCVQFALRFPWLPPQVVEFSSEYSKSLYCALASDGPSNSYWNSFVMERFPWSESSVSTAAQSCSHDCSCRFLLLHPLKQKRKMVLCQTYSNLSSCSSCKEVEVWTLRSRSTNTYLFLQCKHYNFYRNRQNDAI